MQVAVIGAGIAGIVTALALHSTGVEVQVYEQAPEVPAHDPPGLAVLSPNASRILRALRLLEPVTAAASAPAWLHVRTPRSGYALASRSLAAVAGARYGAPWLHIGSEPLLQLLTTAARQRHITLHYDARFHGLSNAGALRINADELPPPDVIVGADGSGSSLAAQLGLKQPRGQSNWFRWQGIAPLARLPEQLLSADAHCWPGAHCQLFHCAAGPGQHYWEVLSPSAAPLAEQFGDWNPVVVSLLATSPDGAGPQPLAYFDAPVDLAAANCVLVGDAAHALLGHVNQGVALALEDAWVLAHLLEDWDDDPSGGLREYAIHRSARVRRVAALAHSDARQMLEQSTWQRRRRHLGMALRCRLLPEMDMQRDDWLYGYDAVRHYG